ncbi:NADH-ubiquinone oxidoreductase chain 5 [Tetrabaena socialis]|uniref:NADH-ubiquinone oxidoreductase chain 5 n=1 Tax=Tetrabaena socialis TaxID=47790 RepID=A0A2J7ZW26_9CHLO|nr:NADH-ubiquinone oxidoreductase chain 5 [Tetrabaena socialis]|eukprot:PNH04473.1 NADH-ubiquinone oxidoreductase chain 5 [Tetrabaena socialis]
MQVGRNYMVTRYNPVTRRMEPSWQTDWRTVVPGWRYNRRWGAETSETQVYGGSKYRHDPAIDKMSPGEHVRRALPYSEYAQMSADDVRQGPRAGGGPAAPERMVPFRMSPGDAVAAVRSAVRAAELRNAEQQLLRQYGGDQVRLVVMDLELAPGRLAASPVFVPVWVFKMRIRNTAMRTYVAGFASGLSAGPKAILVNRISDGLLMWGILWVWYHLGALEYDLLNVYSASGFVGLSILIGAMGKSAQVLFHVWLADAMEGPTPVSALIHAATLVTAGVYLLVRLHIHDEMFVIIVGSLTAFMAGVFGATQSDLKRVIAYSTCSQYWPELHAQLLGLRARLQRALPDADEAEQERWWREEWVRQDPEDAYSYDSEGRYSGSSSYDGGRQQQAGAGEGAGGRGRQRGSGAGARASSLDPKGYYRALGVEPNSSTSEIQAAYRAAALRWHPDRQPDPARKAESTRRFQAVQEAYATLRDPARRAAYQRSGA